MVLYTQFSHIWVLLFILYLFCKSLSYVLNTMYTVFFLHFTY